MTTITHHSMESLERQTHRQQRSQRSKQRKRRKSSFSISLQQTYTLLLSLLLLFPNNLITSAYKIGDAIGLSIRTIQTTSAPSSFSYGTSYHQKEALRNQVPLFGTYSTCTMQIPLKSSKSKYYNGGVSLSFADGSMSIPWYNTVKGGKSNKKKDFFVLNHILVTFVYSRGNGGGGGGAGEIHSIKSQPVYLPQKDNQDLFLDDEEENSVPVQVMYVWVEEASVNMVGGTLVMFLGTIVCCLVISVLICQGNLHEEKEEEEEERMSYTQQQQQEYEHSLIYGKSGYEGDSDMMRSSAYRRGGGGGKWD